MNSLILLVFCFFVGMLLRQSKRMPDNAPATLNSFIIHVSLPALTLLYIHGLKLDSSVLLAGLMAWILFGFSVLFFGIIGKYRHWSRSSTGALILVGGLGNTSFFGLPMIEAFYGKAGMTTGIIVDQLGSFLVLSLLGITVAGVYSAGRPTLVQLAKRIAVFPPFIALLIALLLIPFEYADWFVILLHRLGDTLAPLALLSVGLQLRLEHIAEHWHKLSLGLSFKLVFAPLLIYFLYVPLLGGHGQSTQILVFEAAMPSMITASIVASEHHLNPPLANLLVAVGLLLSFFSLTVWWWFLRNV